jgi:anti-sigma factor RsiW
MSTHERIHSLLPLAAAAVLDPADTSAVDAHLDECPECRRELQRLRLYTEGLRTMPQPAVPNGLLQRTAIRAIHAREQKAARHKEALALGLLGGFSCAMGIVFWLMARTFLGGLGFTSWSMISAVLASTTAGAAALGLRRGNAIFRGELYE